MKRPIIKNSNGDFVEGWNQGTFKLIEHLIKKAGPQQLYVGWLQDNIEDFPQQEFLVETSTKIKGNLTSEHRIPFGKWKGSKLRDIPIDYFKWIVKQEDGFKDKPIYEYAVRVCKTEAKSSDPCIDNVVNPY